MTTRMTAGVSKTSTPRIGLVRFPGSNCDADCIDAIKRHFGIDLQLVWHSEVSLPPLDGVIIPGGFSFGDYLRSGALASHSPVMQAIKVYANRGGAVLGICNGFQILTEAQLLPGALLHNDSRLFICQAVDLAVAEGSSGYHKALKQSKQKKTYRIPIAHGEGRYYASADDLDKLFDQGQVLFQYVREDGELDEANRVTNPNGSTRSIAGIVSANGRVMGLMPHPERACDKILSGSSDDGIPILKAFLSSCL